MTSAALIRRRRSSASLLSLYSALGIRPELAFDFANERYFTSRVPTTFSDAITHTRASTATYVDSSGVLQTAASGEPRVGHHVWDGSAWVNEGLLHESEARTNLVTNNQLSGAVVGVIGSGGALPTNWSSANFDTVEVVSIDTWLGKDRIRIKGTRTNSTGSSVFPAVFVQSGLTLAASTAYTGSLWFGEGPDQTGSRASWVLSDGSTFFVNQQISAPGTFAEPVFFTRSASTSAAPTAFGSMRLVATVEDGNTEVFDWVIVLPQFEQGATPSSPIPTSGATVTRAADVLTIPSANLPWNPLAVNIQMDGAINYSDEGIAAQQTLLRWQLDANNYISVDLDTDSTATGEVNFNQAASGTVDTVATAGTALSPSIATAFNIASRHGSTFINGALNGTALTEDTTPVALADLSAKDLNLGFDYNGTIRTFRVWANDIGDTGIEEAST